MYRRPSFADLAPAAVIADKGYGPDAFVERLEARDITPVIPPKANRTNDVAPLKSYARLHIIGLPSPLADHEGEAWH